MNKKKIALNLIAVTIFTVGITLKGTTSNTTTLSTNKAPLIELTYIKARNGDIVKEFNDGMSWQVINAKDNKFICHVNDSIDNSYNFNSMEEMETFFNAYYNN